MVKRLLLSFTSALIVIFLLAPCNSYAHGGDTDWRGGHINHSTGEYHYHHGYPAHLHTDGVCPYDYDDKTGESSGGSSSGGSGNSSAEVTNIVLPDTDEGTFNIWLLLGIVAVIVWLIYYYVHKTRPPQNAPISVPRTSVPIAPPPQVAVVKPITPYKEGVTLTLQNGVYRKQIPPAVPIPDNVAIGADGLPYLKNRQYGWGRMFNAFIVPNSKKYHRSDCPSIKGHSKSCIHLYEAISKYEPCQICKPRCKIDDWFKEK